MDIATPIMAACLMVTTTETVDGSYSTVATRVIVGCTACMNHDCPEPVWFTEAKKVYAELYKPLPTAKQKRRMGRK